MLGSLYVGRAYSNHVTSGLFVLSCLYLRMGALGLWTEAITLTVCVGIEHSE